MIDMSDEIKQQVISVREYSASRIAAKWSSLDSGTDMEDLISYTKQCALKDLNESLSKFAFVKEAHSTITGDVTITASIHMPYVADEAMKIITKDRDTYYALLHQQYAISRRLNKELNYCELPLWKRLLTKKPPENTMIDWDKPVTFHTGDV